MKGEGPMSDTLTTARATNVQFSLPDAGSVATTALQSALAFCAKKMRLADADAALDLLRQRDGVARNYFEYGLAQHLAEHLGALDDEVQAVYLYDPENAPDDVRVDEGLPTLVHLVIWAKRRTSALESALAGVDRAITERYGELMGAPELRHLLDVQVVDDSEVASRRGFGAMLAWLHRRPLMIWKR
jgi:hypothetical protein